MPEQVLNQIRKALRGADSALILTHADPDGDAVGSAIALGLVLEKLGITATVCIPDGIPKVYRFLPQVEKARKTFLEGSHFTLGFILDSSDLRRVGDKFNVRKVASIIINIDHHPDNSKFGDINYVEKTASVAELIFQLGKYLKVEMDRNIAECLYTAVITDTGNFRYQNTTVATFLMAAELVKLGVDTDELTSKIYDTKSLASLKILASVLNNLEFAEGGRIAWSIITEETMLREKAQEDDLVGLVDKIRSLEGVEVAILFREAKGKIKINFRSKKKVNVGEIAARFGGGGHVKAAGATVAGSMEEVKKRVVEEAVKYLQASKFLV